MKILYIDDELIALEKFLVDHASSRMSIETCNDVSRVLGLLSSKKEQDLPDVIVTDLYSTKADFNSAEAIKVNKLVDGLVDKIAALRQELQEIVEKSKSPTALTTLRELKNSSKLNHIPVVINTREGLTLLDDHSFQETISLGATWMLKGRSPKSQRQIITRALSESNSKHHRKKEKLIFMAIGAVLSAVISVIIQFLLT